jgi:hypothetical protein
VGFGDIPFASFPQVQLTTALLPEEIDLSLPCGARVRGDKRRGSKSTAAYGKSRKRRARESIVPQRVTLEPRLIIVRSSKRPCQKKIDKGNLG